MASIAEHREISVRDAVLLHPENGVMVGIGLWDNLAKILLPLIGKYDFELLFSRSLYINKMRYDGTGTVSGNVSTGARRSVYADLQDRLRDYGLEARNLAIIELLDTFIDALVLFIGEGLTEQVLNLAWHGRRPSRSHAGQQHTS
jgi:hypothetical protein